MNKVIIVLIVLIVASVLSGCVEQAPKQEIISQDSITIPGNAYRTEIIKIERSLNEPAKTIVTGKLVEIRLGTIPRQRSILIFEDGVVISAGSAEDYIYHLGKIHKITILEIGLIEKVEIQP